MSEGAESSAAPAVEGGCVASEAEDPATSQRLLAFLEAQGFQFTRLTHAPTRTCEESAAVRGVDVASGAKAMLLKCSKNLPHGTPYLLAVLSAAKKADLKSLRASLGQKSVSLASREDVKRLTGCIPGAVPPFGSLFPGVKTYADPSILSRETMNFNCGLQTLSVVGLLVCDFVKAECPTTLEFAAKEEGEA